MGRNKRSKIVYCLTYPYVPPSIHIYIICEIGVQISIFNPCMIILQEASYYRQDDSDKSTTNYAALTITSQYSKILKGLLFKSHSSMFPFLNVQEGNIKEVQSLLISVKRKMRGTTNQENQEIIRKTWIGIGSCFPEGKLYHIIRHR